MKGLMGGAGWSLPGMLLWFTRAHATSTSDNGKLSDVWIDPRKAKLLASSDHLDSESVLITEAYCSGSEYRIDRRARADLLGSSGGEGR